MSDDRRVLADNVRAFLDKACTDHGHIMADRFSQEMWLLIVDCLQSPIEDLFEIACYNLCQANCIEVNSFEHRNITPDGNFVKPDQRLPKWLRFAPCVLFTPQAQIGKFKVDFLLEANWPPEWHRNVVFSPVIVELDGHDFHDKDKHQRAYEKGRDRFLVRAGYRVLHYTGSEVAADPYKCAHEALNLIGVCDDDYDPSNPMGIE